MHMHASQIRIIHEQKLYVDIAFRGGAKGGQEGTAAPPDLPQNLYIIV